MAIVKGRWAKILKDNGSGQAEVISIDLMEGSMPELNQDAADRYDVEEVDERVMIGMVRGGPVNSVGGFGFPEGADLGGRYGPGVTRTADLTRKPAVDETALPAVSHEKQRGTEAPQEAEETSSSKASGRRGKGKRKAA